jgi:hypothetical protein
MKKLFVIAILLQIFQSGYSQFEYYNPEDTRTSHTGGDFSISASPDLLLKTPNGVQFAGGIKMQLFLGERFSLDGDIVFGKDYVHFGPGLIGLPILLLAGNALLSDEGISFGDGGESLSNFLFSLAAIALSFEHISYNIPIKNHTDISPYVSFLRYKYAYAHGKYSDPDYTGEQLSFATGVQLNKYFGRFVLSPYTEYNIGYKDHISGYNVGVYCGFIFPVKR